MNSKYYWGPADADARAKRLLQRVNKRKLATKIVEQGRRRRRLIRVCIAGVLALAATMLLSGWGGSRDMQLALASVAATAPPWSAAVGIDAAKKYR